MLPWNEIIQERIRQLEVHLKSLYPEHSIQVVNDRHCIWGYVYRSNKPCIPSNGISTYRWFHDRGEWEEVWNHAD